MSRYEELDVFVRTVEAGSITGAAGQLHIAKSAVSRRLRELEGRLGTQLLVRSTRKLSLTPEGEALYQRAVDLLADWAEAEASVRVGQGALSGRIRLAAPLSFGLAHLGPAILDFMKQHPAIDFDTDFNDRTVNLVEEGVDLAIRIGDLPDSSLIARKIAPIMTVAVASPAYLSAHGEPTHPQDLAEHRELRYAHRSRRAWTYKMPKGEAGRVEMPVRLQATNGDFLREAALAGEGVLIEPCFLLYKALRAGTLRQILPDVQWPELGAYAVYPPTRHLSARVRAFVDFLAHRFGTCPYWNEW